MRAAALVICCLLTAACGGNERAATTARKASKPARTAAPPAVRVATVGAVALPDNVATVPADEAQLVFVQRGSRPPTDVPAGAHVVLVGRSHERLPGQNVSGLLFRDDEAAYLAGVVAALVTAEEGGLERRVAWVGTRRPGVVGAFARGARSIVPRPTVLRTYAEADATRCKEAALAAIARGATVVFSGIGPCALGARAATQEQNAVGLSLDDFEHPRVAVAQTIADAEQGLFHEDEDVVFGAASGAVDVGRLGRRVSPDTVVRARQVAQELASGLRSP